MPSPPRPRGGWVALAGRRFEVRGEGISVGHLALSWDHTRSFRLRSRGESEQSCGSFCRQTIIFAFGSEMGAGSSGAAKSPRLTDSNPRCPRILPLRFAHAKAIRGV